MCLFKFRYQYDLARAADMKRGANLAFSPPLDDLNDKIYFLTGMFFSVSQTNWNSLGTDGA